MKKTIYILAEGLIGFGIGIFTGVRRVNYKVEKELEAYTHGKQRLEENIDLLNMWIKKLHDGKTLVDFCKKEHYKKVAVYGMNYMGERVLEELNQGQIDVLYGIDKAAQSIESDINVVTPEDILEPVDAVIVTPIYYFDEIKEDLQQKMHCPILSLEHMVYKL